MKIYTKTGDKGQTGLIGGLRVPKDDPRVEAYGTVDELNAAIGMSLAFLPTTTANHESSGLETSRLALLHVQRVLFDLGAELATPPGDRKARWELDEAEITRVERAIDGMEEALEPLRNFILPGGHPAGASLHLARTAARRAERAVVSLASAQVIEPKLLQYLNRLSDYLFVLSRFINQHLGAPEILVSDDAQRT